MVIKEERFAYKNLTDIETFPTTLIKHEKQRINQDFNFPRDTKQQIRENVTNNSCNTQIVQILCKKRDVKFLFNGNLLSLLPNPLEISQ